VGPDPKSDELERWLADHIDGPAAGPISELVAHRHFGTIDNGKRSILAAYTAAQSLRTPKTRDFIINVFQRGIAAEWQGSIQQRYRG
jgi:hypothetical protein